VRILISSRSSLRISGEQECPVPPLAVPGEEARPTAASLAACESVRLFAERAAAAVPGFAVDDQNAPAIAHIARRLDGLPLAIELAAARVKLLPPEAILPRLEHSLGLLTGGRRDVPDRQQTLRATIAWSYDLLTEEARRLLAVCSVFAGGASLEAVETVCDTGVVRGLPGHRHASARGARAGRAGPAGRPRGGARRAGPHGGGDGIPARPVHRTGAAAGRG
jgi:predicted ATPase